MYKEEGFFQLMANTHNIDENTAMRHLDSHALICSSRMVPGDERLVFWGTDGPTLNVWRGYTVKEMRWGRSTGLPYVPETAIWLYTVFTRMCRGEVLLFKRFISWCAFMFQRPLEKPGLALVLASTIQGTGKNSVMAVIDGIVGVHSKVITSTDRLTATNNGFVATATACIVDECARSGRPEDAEHKLGQINAQVTESTVFSKMMYRDPEEQPSYTKFIFLSNSPDAGFNFSSPMRRFQFFPVVERRLWGMVGAILKNPRNRNEFFGQILHLFKTIKHDDQLHEAIETSNARVALKKGLEMAHPIIRVLYEMCIGTVESVATSFMGVRNYCQHRCKSRNEPYSDEENSEFTRRALLNGFFPMPRSTAMKRLAAAVGHHSGAPLKLSTMLSDFNQRLSRTPVELLAMVGIRENAVYPLDVQPMDEDAEGSQQRIGDNAVEILRDLASNIGTNTIIPVTPAGWRQFVEWSTNIDFAKIHETFNIDVVEELEGRHVAEVSSDQLEEIMQYGVEMRDSMWTDIAHMIDHVQANQLAGVAVFAKSLSDSSPLLLPMAELAGADGEGVGPDVVSKRYEVASIINSCVIDGCIGGEDRSLAEVIISELLDETEFIAGKASMPASVTLLHAMQRKYPLPDQSYDMLEKYVADSQSYALEVCWDIATSKTVPNIDFGTAEVSGWALVCRAHQQSALIDRAKMTETEEFQRILREMFSQFGTMLRIIDTVDAPPRGGIKMCNINLLHRFLEKYVPLVSGIEEDEAKVFLFGDEDKFVAMINSHSATSLIKRQGLSETPFRRRDVQEDLYFFFKQRVKMSAKPEGFVEARNEYTHRQLGNWFNLFYIWEVTGGRAPLDLGLELDL